MEKPIVFFSHSSKDKKFLTRLKEMIDEKTGKSIDIFLSSDGESIPLGRNWVHSIQEALENCHLMFVFISPNSLRSNWLFFESGFAYSKKIKVVPVGILGVDLGTLPPPLSLLQGFNVATADSLGNIIALVNETFSHSHQAKFSDSEFDELSPQGEDIRLSALGDYTRVVDLLRIDISKDELLYDISEIIEKVIEAFEQEGAAFHMSVRAISTHGLQLSKESDRLFINIDPILTAITLPLLERILNCIRTDGVKGISFTIFFVDSVRSITGGQWDSHRIAARLYNTDVELGDKDDFIVEGTRFEIYRREPDHIRMKLTCECNTLSEMKLDELLNLLFERGVLFVDERAASGGQGLF